MLRYGSYGTNDEQFFEPKSIATDGSNNVYVVDVKLAKIINRV